MTATLAGARKETMQVLLDSGAMTNKVALLYFYIGV
jgi:hypothetical protein